MSHSEETDTEGAEAPVSAKFWSLALGSVGVVYGDIGTSPLYAFREATHAAAHGGAVTREIVLGVLWVLDGLVARQALTKLGAAAALELILRCGGRLPASECQKRLSAWRRAAGQMG